MGLSPSSAWSGEVSHLYLLNVPRAVAIQSVHREHDAPPWRRQSHSSLPQHWIERVGEDTPSPLSRTRRSPSQESAPMSHPLSFSASHPLCPLQCMSLPVILSSLSIRTLPSTQLYVWNTVARNRFIERIKELFSYEVKSSIQI